MQTSSQWTLFVPIRALKTAAISGGCRECMDLAYEMAGRNYWIRDWTDDSD